MKKQKAVILFSRLSGYMLNLFHHWTKVSDVELHIFRKEVDQKEAPFVFSDKYNDIFLYDEHRYDTIALMQKVEEIWPDMIFCAGWMDKRYLHVTGNYSGKVPTVMSMDTQWSGKLKQYVAMLASRLFLRNRFSFVWVPGKPQTFYAKRLGFRDDQIIEGFYVADHKKFSKQVINPEGKMAKRFLFVGRYIDIKGITDLWQAFVQLQKEQGFEEWELYCIGTGTLYDQRVQHPNIKHIGFVQPEELAHYMSEGGIFVLPSHYEPWGVVVHEFALAGFPLIVSNVVGAASSFVDAQNGVVFEAGDVASLESSMKTMASKDIARLKEMGLHSFEKAKVIDENQWVRSADAMMKAGGK